MNIVNRFLMRFRYGFDLILQDVVTNNQKASVRLVDNEEKRLSIRNVDVVDGTSLWPGI